MSKAPRKLPKTASVAIPQGGQKLHAPAAQRNVEPILQAIKAIVPARGQALEIASGTGEHIIRYAAAHSGLHWQPTDIEPMRLSSIDAWAETAGLPNLAKAQPLNASRPGWAADWPPQDLIILSNLLHLISEAEAGTVLDEAAKALASGGVCIIYGPFMRGREFASEGDRRFHESLRAQAPEIGYKPAQWVHDSLAKAGLASEPPQDMPANNLLLVARKP